MFNIFASESQIVRTHMVRIHKTSFEWLHLFNFICIVKSLFWRSIFFIPKISVGSRDDDNVRDSNICPWDEYYLVMGIVQVHSSQGPITWQTGCFPTKDMQSPPIPSPLRSGHLYIKYGECAESNGKLNFRLFRFLDFELFSSKELPNQL